MSLSKKNFVQKKFRTKASLKIELIKQAEAEIKEKCQGNSQLKTRLNSKVELAETID